MTTTAQPPATIVPENPDRTVLTDLQLSHAVFTATIDAPIEKIDIADWVLNLPDREYQLCAPPDHKAAGYTTSEDGRPMSINVEVIGSGLVIQHYVAEEAEADHCHMNSISDVLTAHGWTTVNVIWCLKAERIDDTTSKYTNTVTCHPTQEFLDFIAQNGQTFEEAAAARQAGSEDHCRRETPLFAASIGRKANATA
jgi:hypothetical protein